MQNHET